MRDEQERRAQRLDLERPRRLARERVVEAVRRQDREREEDERRRDDERGHDREARAPPVTPPGVRGREREQDARPELRREGEPEDGAARDPPPREQRRQGEQRERRGPEVEAGADDRPQRERREGGEHQGRPEAPRTGPERPQGQPERDERDRPADPHLQLERTPVGAEVVRVAEGREREDGERARRVLEPEVAVGGLPPGDRVAVGLVDGDVGDHEVPVEADVDRRPGRGEERDRAGDRDPRLPREVSGRGPALGPRDHGAPARAGRRGARPGRAGRAPRTGRTTGCRGRTSASARARSRAGARR